MRPKSINLFEMLGWAATGLGALSVLIMLIQALSQRAGPPAAAYLVLIFILLLFAALGAATFYAAKRRHEVGRWGFVVTAAVIAILLVSRLGGLGFGSDGMGALYLILDMLTLAAMMAATISLLQPDAHAWFAQGPLQPAHRPATQSAFPGYGAPPPGGSAYPPAPYPPGTQYPPAIPARPVQDPLQGIAYPPAASAEHPDLAEPTRRCPFCAEEIKAEASKCRFCGSAVEPLAR